MSTTFRIASLRHLTRASRCSAPRACNNQLKTRTQAFAFSRQQSTKAQSHAAPGNARRQGTPTQAEKDSLSWPDYLAIRKLKRRWETAVTIPLTIVAFAGGVVLIGNIEMDMTKPIFGLDPMMIYGFTVLACAGTGYLLGPLIGSIGWRTTHKRLMKLIEQRDREFYQHIVKNRVDASAQTATNPIPDFHGEKIGSLHDYRQWLRDQAKYKRKAYLPEDQ